ncbi:MAG: hypothetical protein GC171_06185 [Terrimonas sp.]|nr:hypothetical protein [Terrimonas sp.]
MFKRKIIQINPTGDVSDFIKPETDGIWSVVGMEVDEQRDILWVNTAHANEVLPLMHPDTTRDWMTGVFAYKIGPRKLFKKYILKSPKAFLNDLTVTPRGDVFATESVNNVIYQIDYPYGGLELFLEVPGFHFLNGITYDDELHVLFVASTEGILKIDVATKEYYLLKTADSMNAGGIDGLAYYHNSLIGHQSSKVSRFYLNADKTEIIHSEILDTGIEFDSSTTGEVGNGAYYFIVNSQVSSGVEPGKGKIKPMDSLENVIIRKLKLE